MDVCRRILVSCCFIRTIIRQRKKNIAEIKNIEKYGQKNVYVRIVCVYVCVDYICLLLICHKPNK